MTDEIKDNLNKVLEEIEGSRGPVALFVLFQRKDIFDSQSLEKWDLVIGASWITQDTKREIEEYIFSLLIKYVGSETLIDFLYKLKTFSTKSDFVHAYTKAVGDIESVEEKRFVRVDHTPINGVDRSLIFVSRPETLSGVEATETSADFG